MVLIITFTGKQSYYNGQYMHLFTQQLYIKGYTKMYMTDHTFIIGFCTCKSIWLLTEFYVVLNKADKTLITCLLNNLFSIGNCHFNDIWHFVDWINFIGIAWFLSMYFIYLLFLSCHSSQRFHIVNTFRKVWLVCVFTCITVNWQSFT